MTKSKRFFHRGAASLELAMVLPVHVALLAAILYLGMGVHRQLELANATRSNLWQTRFAGTMNDFDPFNLRQSQGDLSLSNMRTLQTGLYLDSLRHELHSSHLLFDGTWSTSHTTILTASTVPVGPTNEFQAASPTLAPPLEESASSPQGRAVYRPVKYTAETEADDDAASPVVGGDSSGKQLFGDQREGVNRSSRSVFEKGDFSIGDAIKNRVRVQLPTLEFSNPNAPKTKNEKEKEKGYDCGCFPKTDTLLTGKDLKYIRFFQWTTPPEFLPNPEQSRYKTQSKAKSPEKHISTTGKKWIWLNALKTDYTGSKKPKWKEGDTSEHDITQIDRVRAELERSRNEWGSQFKVHVIVHGMRNYWNEDWLREMAHAIERRHDALKQANPTAKTEPTLIFLVSWNELSYALAGVLASTHIFTVADRAEEFLFRCLGLVPEETHIIGHSHGAHISGQIGMNLSRQRPSSLIAATIDDYVTGKTSIPGGVIADVIDNYITEDEFGDVYGSVLTGRLRRVTSLDPSDEVPHDWFAAPQQLTQGRGKTNEWTPDGAARFVDSYKSSKIMGSEYAHGHDNFYLVMADKHIGNEIKDGLNLTDDHGFANAWYTQTISSTTSTKDYTILDTPLGYAWESESWSKLTGQLTPCLARSGWWRGVIQEKRSDTATEKWPANDYWDKVNKPEIQCLNMFSGKGYHVDGNARPVDSSTNTATHSIRYSGGWQNVYGSTTGMLFGFSMSTDPNHPNYVSDDNALEEFLHQGCETYLEIIEQLGVEAGIEKISELIPVPILNYALTAILEEYAKKLDTTIKLPAVALFYLANNWDMPSPRCFARMVELEIGQVGKIDYGTFKHSITVRVQNNADNRAERPMVRRIVQNPFYVNVWLTYGDRDVPDSKKDILLGREKCTALLGYFDVHGDSKNVKVTLNKRLLKTAAASMAAVFPPKLIIELGDVFSDPEKAATSGELYYENNKMNADINLR